jgi:hypothetical protein
LFYIDLFRIVFLIVLIAQLKTHLDTDDHLYTFI